MFDTKESLLLPILNCMPNPELINNLDFTSEPQSIIFKWRGNIFRIYLSGEVEEIISEGVSSFSNCSILLQTLLKNYWASKLFV